MKSKEKLAKKKKKIQGKIKYGEKKQTHLLGVVKAFEVVFAEEGTVFWLSASGHAFAEVHPEIVASAFVTGDSPTRRHFRSRSPVQ